MAYMTDASAVLGAAVDQKVELKHSTSKKAGADLDTTDFLTLMCAMFQNQDIDNTASTTDMMNQMVQISVIQAITDISALINDTTTLTYASSLVGQEVTIGEYVGGELKETYGRVTGTGQLDGEQVIFIGDQIFKLSNVMAVGKLPEIKDPDKVEGDKTDGTVTKPGNTTDTTDKTETDNKTETDKTEGTTEKPETSEDAGNNQTNNGAAQANPEVRMA